MATEEQYGSINNISDQTEGDCPDCTTRERSFDALARSLANGALSRRRVLRLMGGVLLGSMLASVPRVAVAEKCKLLGRKCTANVQCCSRFCDKRGQVCACPPKTQIECQGPRGQARCVDICHDPTNPCEVSLCNPTTGNCVVNRLTGTPCNDNNPCTIGDTCQNGTCQPGPVKNCGQCLGCNPNTANGACEPDPNQVGNRCNDGNACTEDDRCTPAGMCVGTLVDCDDDNPCTIDTCDPATGCVRTNVTDGTPCDDGNPCTIGDTCQNGTCQPGEPLECGQCLTCEGGICVPDQGQNGMACNDENPCTANDACQSGVCIGIPIPGCVVCATPQDCPVPANPCLLRTCVARVCGVGPKPDGTQCDDENACTTNDTCQSGVCMGELVDCDDDNPCTVDTCNPATGCVHTSVTNGTPCETGNLCTSGTCQNGRCTQGTVNVTCPQCRKCDPDTGTCEADPSKNGNSCNDGNLCTTGEKCQNGICTGGTPKSCGSCTQCNPATGNCDPISGAPCGAGGGGICCAGSCCQGVNICCSTGSFAGQCKRGPGITCSNNNQCCSERCVVVGDNRVCA